MPEGSEGKPVLYELVDKDGRPAGYESVSAVLLGQCAKTLWPDQQQDEDRIGEGWDVQVVGAE